MMAMKGVFTETFGANLHKTRTIFKGLEIIKRLKFEISKKNVYFADQIRFLEKLIINNKYNNKRKCTHYS